MLLLKRFSLNLFRYIIYITVHQQSILFGIIISRYYPTIGYIHTYIYIYVYIEYIYIQYRKAKSICSWKRVRLWGRWNPTLTYYDILELVALPSVLLQVSFPLHIPYLTLFSPHSDPITSQNIWKVETYVRYYIAITRLPPRWSWNGLTILLEEWSTWLAKESSIEI